MQDLKNRFHNKQQTGSRSHQKRFDIQYNQSGWKIKSSKKTDHLFSRLLLKESSSSKASNPAYGTEKPQASSLRIFFGLTSFLFLLFVLLGITLKSYDHFQHSPNQIHIEGASLLSAVEIYEIMGITPDMKLNEIDTFLISNRLNRHPAIKQAEIRQIFPDQLYILLKERRPYGYLKTGKQYYLIDHERYPIRHIPAGQVGNQLIITGVEKELVQLGKPIPSAALEKGMQLLELMQTSNFDLGKIAVVDVSDILNIKLKLQTTNSIVQLGQGDYLEKIKRFQTIYPQLLQQHQQLHSIDLRYQNKAIVQF